MLFVFPRILIVLVFCFRFGLVGALSVSLTRSFTRSVTFKVGEFAYQLGCFLFCSMPIFAIFAVKGGFLSVKELLLKYAKWKCVATAIGLDLVGMSYLEENNSKHSGNCLKVCFVANLLESLNNLNSY